MSEKKAHAESLRRSRIGELIERLAAVLPKHLVCKNSHQADILNSAITFIKECVETPQNVTNATGDVKFLSKIQNLETYIKDLESRCQRYAKLLDVNGICRNPSLKVSTSTNTSEEPYAEPEYRLLSSIHQASVSSVQNVQVDAHGFFQQQPVDCVQTPIILVVQERIGGGRRRKTNPQSALDMPLRPLRPKLSDSDVQEANVLQDVVNTVQTEPYSDKSDLNDANLEDEPSVIVNIGDEDIARHENEEPTTVPLENNVPLVTTREIDVQTVADSFFINRGTSPAQFADEPQIINCRSQTETNVNVANSKKAKQSKTTSSVDAISEIVNFVGDSSVDFINTNQNVCTNDPKARSKLSYTPSLLRVEDMLQQNVLNSSGFNGDFNSPVNQTTSAAAQHSNSQKPTSSGHQQQFMKMQHQKTVARLNPKRPATTKQRQQVKRTSVVDIGEKQATSSNPSSSWNEFLPNFAQVFPSYGHQKQAEPNSVESIGNNGKFRNNLDGLSASSVIHVSSSSVAGFSIDSLRDGVVLQNKTRISSSNGASASGANPKAAVATKLTHFPCTSSSSGAASSNVVSRGVPSLHYPEMPMFLPCLPPPSAPFHDNPMCRSRRSDVSTISSLQTMTNPLVQSDSSNEVNLSNSIFDMQGNSTSVMNCASLVGPYNATSNFYNFQSKVVDERSGGELHSSVPWQWSEPPTFCAQTYTQPSLDVHNSSGQKVQNFHIASMFPEATTTPSVSATTNSNNSYRWSESNRVTNDPMLTSASMPSFGMNQYHPQDSSASGWALPQLRPYNSSSSQERNSNSFMPSFNFSHQQSNNHV